MELFEGRKQQFLSLADDRANALVKAYGSFKKIVGGQRYEAVYPILPPDILGVYVFIPMPGGVLLE